jgi:acylpyruvate hydrolase
LTPKRRGVPIARRRAAGLLPVARAAGAGGAGRIGEAEGGGLRLVTFERKDRPGRRLGALLGSDQNDRLVDLNRILTERLLEDPEAPEVEANVLPPDALAFLRGGSATLDAARRALDATRAELVREGDLRLRRAGALVELHEAVLHAPVPRPGKIVGVARNYAAHAREQGQAVPEEPVLFIKASSAVVGPSAEIVIPSAAQQVDFEGELAAVIGVRAKEVPVSQALAHVVGYTVANDVTARDFQDVRGQRFLGKSCDTFAPLGPALVTRDEVGDPQDLAILTRVSGEVMQSARTGEMIFPVSALVAFASRLMTLEPGDVLLTGTPAGVGKARRPPRWLRAGDLVEVSIERVGTLRNRVRGADAPSHPASGLQRRSTRSREAQSLQPSKPRRKGAPCKARAPRTSSDAGAVGLLVPMQTTLLGLRILPPPAARARVLSRLHGPCAGRAAHAGKSLGVKPVHRQAVRPHVLPHLIRRPIHQRVDLHEATIRVDLDLARLAARDALLPAEPGHVGVQLCQVAAIWLHLAQATAELALGQGLVEEVHAVLANHLLDRLRVGEHHLDLHVVAVAHAIDEVVGRLVKTTGVEDEDPRARLEGTQHVEQHEPLRVPEGTGERQAGMKILDRPRKDFPGLEQLQATAFNILQDQVRNRFSPDLAGRGEDCAHAGSSGSAWPPAGNTSLFIADGC